MVPSTAPVDEINAAPGNTNNNLSLDALILLTNAERLKRLKESTHTELKDLKERQAKVRQLHNLLRAINSSTDNDGKLDGSKNEKFQEALKIANELGVELDPTKLSYSKDERERLIENIRMTISDFTVENEMQMQTISRLTNERHESYQMARSILKPLHDAKMRHLRGMSGGG